jgi:hypothetical protein
MENRALVQVRQQVFETVAIEAGNINIGQRQIVWLCLTGPNFQITDLQEIVGRFILEYER